MYSEQNGYEINVAFCENILGLACIHLREWELGEEYFAAVLDQFQKSGGEKFILMVRHNLDWMYSNQNMLTLAIRYLSEVVEKNPKHYKAIFAKTLEHYKLVRDKQIKKYTKRKEQFPNEESMERFLVTQFEDYN